MSFQQRLKDAQIKVLTIDIENYAAHVRTWGLFKQNIGLNQIVEPSRTFGVAYKWYHEKQAHFLSEFDMEPEVMFQRVHELLSEADIVLHYNGTSFDLPHLNKHFVMLRMNPPRPYKQIDLLRVARKQFNFMSNKLDFVAGELGLGSKTSHDGFDLWTRCEQGDKKAQQLMTKYAKQDVVLTEKLYNVLLPWIPNHPHLGQWTANPWSCPNCGADIDPETREDRTAKTFNQQYNSFQCVDCGHWVRSTTKRADVLKTRSQK